MILPIAHGIGGRADLPIPEWLFVWAAALVLVLSFAALAVLWPEPRLEGARFRPLAKLSRVLLSWPVELLCGAFGVFLLGVTVWAGIDGIQTPPANFAPTFVFVTFWTGVVGVSMVFGNVFRAFNPWRAIGRAVSWLARTAARGPIPAPLSYPERLGHWPAAAGIFLFACLELVVSDGDVPETVALATVAYSIPQFVGMALYGVEEWCERGEAFGVYFGLFARISPWARREREIGIVPPLSQLADFRALPGTVALLATMIGSVTFDGLRESPFWAGLVPDLTSFFESVGLSIEKANEAAFLLGLIACVVVVGGFYRLGVLGARSVGGGFSARALGDAFVASLVPIALAYVAAHYMTQLLYEGQAVFAISLEPLGYLASNPLGDETTNFFGTVDKPIDYSVIGATAAWYWQVGFVVVGHVAALVLAHDKALSLYDDVKLAIRSQYWMLAVMVGFTCLALWLLAQTNTTI